MRVNRPLYRIVHSWNIARSFICHQVDTNALVVYDVHINDIYSVKLIELSGYSRTKRRICEIEGWCMEKIETSAIK